MTCMPIVSISIRERRSMRARSPHVPTSVCAVYSSGGAIQLLGSAETTSLLCTLPLSCCASMVRVACLGAGYGTYATMLVGPFDANDHHDARLT